MRNNRGKAIRRYNHAISNNSVTDDIKADWAFATSVFSAFNTLRDRNDNTSTFVEIIDAAPRRKHKSKLRDVLMAGSTLKHSFYANYSEKAAAATRRKTVKKIRPNLLDCFDSVGRGDIQDYNMLSEDETMDISSSSSSSDESSTDYLYSSEEDDDDDDEEEEEDYNKLNRDALETLDSMAVNLDSLYDEDSDEEDNVFDRNLSRMVGRIGGEDSSDEEETFFFSNKLKQIYDKRNTFIKDASASAPTLFSNDLKVFPMINQCST